MTQPKHAVPARAVMASVTVTTKGRITVPVDVRRSLGVRVGDCLEFILIAPGQYVVSKAKPPGGSPIDPIDPATKHVTPTTPASELPAPASGKLAQQVALARIAAMHEGLDGPEQQEVRLSDSGVMERIQLDQAKRPAVIGSTGKINMAVPAIEARMLAKAVDLVMSGASWLTAAELPSNAGPVLTGWLAQGRIFALEQQGVQRFPSYAFDSTGEPVPVLKEVLNALAGRSSFQIAAWFESPSVYLDAKRPRELLEQDGPAVVMAALRLVEGAVHG